jgi:photosystem II stability/assembly factor-like uncharacterized protein
MFASVAAIMLISVLGQKEARLPAPPERPVFGMPTESDVPNYSQGTEMNYAPKTADYIPNSFHDDARLNDIFFIDAKHGWAVGDHGTILHTDDGGGEWKIRQSGVSCSLKSVFFINEKMGWAAGGEAKPYSNTGSGVLLFTRDGGQTWKYNAKLMLPMLKKVHFFDTAHGTALGYPSALFPTGTIISDNGGRDWRLSPESNASME